jgi:hypothetical protein
MPTHTFGMVSWSASSRLDQCVTLCAIGGGPAGQLDKVPANWGHWCRPSALLDR